ncbi:MAG: ABC-three component system protein [Bryobacteraceae bacterium]
MRDYRLYELGNEDFEHLVTQLCMEVLGTGTVCFAPGRDGGRDGRFAGTAQSFPSTAAPHSGKFIIQAKHTRRPGASCRDGDFAHIIELELARIGALAAHGELDVYLLFTNRSLPAGKERQIIKRIATIKGVKHAHLIALETITQYLTRRPTIWSNLGFDRYETPFRVNPDDLFQVIHAFHDAVAGGHSGFHSATNFTYVDKGVKNTVNGLSKGYFEYLQRDSLPHFASVKAFLEDPRNEQLRNLYHDAADDLKAKITATRARFTTFDDVLIYAHDMIVESNAALAGKKRLVRAFLHYMYFDCDIGAHAQTHQTP